MLIASTSKLIPNSEEEPIDPRDFQAGIDDSVKNVYNLVDSWIPTDLGPEWGPSSSSNGKTFGSGFEFKARPPGFVFFCLKYRGN